MRRVLGRTLGLGLGQRDKAWLALDDGAFLVKRCGYFFLNWSSCSHVRTHDLSWSPTNLTNVDPRLASTINFTTTISSGPQQNEACHRDEVHPTEQLMVRRHDTFFLGWIHGMYYELYKALHEARAC
ncbi:hypothetical protein Tco_0400767 [Tanacetum coccineum]